MWNNVAQLGPASRVVQPSSCVVKVWAPTTGRTRDGARGILRFDEGNGAVGKRAEALGQDTLSSATGAIMRL